MRPHKEARRETDKPKLTVTLKITPAQMKALQPIQKQLESDSRYAFGAGAIMGNVWLDKYSPRYGTIVVTYIERGLAIEMQRVIQDWKQRKDNTK